MRKFSERHGITKPREAIQIAHIDQRLRNRLWTNCHNLFWRKFRYETDGDDFTRFVLYKIFDGFFGKSVDELSFRSSINLDFIRSWAFEAKWHEFYDFLQFMADFSQITSQGEPFSDVKMRGEIFIENCNILLSEEKSGYRFVGHELCQITDENEIDAIEVATKITDKFSGSREHIRLALSHYADREKPDYRNSIKESISAVESAFTQINGTRSNNLPTALGLAETKGLDFHPALRKGISSIYGWTSDEAGIRHALIEADNAVGETEAKFMLVLCSAFLNYLVVKSTQ